MLERFKEKGQMLTIVAAGLIVVAGVLLINNPTNWMKVLLLVLGVAVVTLLFVGAKTFVKAFVAIIVTLIGASFGFEISSAFDATGALGVSWGLVFLSLFSLCVAISYLFPSTFNRWVLATVIMVLSWFLFLVFASAIPNIWGVLIAAAIGLVLFVTLYVLWPLRGLKNMPVNNLSVAASKKALEKISEKGWNYIDFQERGKRGYLLIWKKDKPEIAYVLYPVRLEQPFGTIGSKKRTGLSYKGHSINFWLQSISFRVAKNNLVGVKPLVVIWAYASAANETKVIGVKTPEYSEPIPVGFLQGRSLHSLKRFDDYTRPLKQKQIEKLEKITSD